MDMNWTVMLHEAAEASFEQEIAALTDAVDDNSSCINISWAKIRETSKKILQLPHQGIVLFFSKYCFRLSPKETEMFFGFENVTGRLRFYRNLLSANIGLETGQTISDASLGRSCKIALKEYLRTEMKEQSGVRDTEKSRVRIVFGHIGKAVAVAAVTFTLLFSARMAVNAQFREKVISWVIETFEKYSSFELQSNGENGMTDLQSYYPTYLPDGAKLEDTTVQQDLVAYRYDVGNSGYINIVLVLSDTKVYVDSEDAITEPLEQDGITGYLIKKDGTNYVCCERDGCFFTVYGTVDTEELIKIAAGITKK